ncbi:DNA cytosine methyltransferase [Pseudomonas monteilii]|uniref:DNA cytosine methyltransferase n=1 Tax=Pseudomonas monteilii TaxID=76759 RepID=UPI00076108CD|nr:DNA cytosine methyltransferase [Pseudomonas monteilii]
MPITYGSVCSGIEAATVAWHPLGWRAEWYAEIEPFPCAVLAHYYPDTPNHGDMTRLAALVLSGKIPAPDVLVGGTPCQAFSVAGMREGLADPRGALTIKYVELLDAIDHVRTKRGEPEAACLWENVPGVLSDKGNAFGCFLGALVGESEELQPPGGKWKDAGCVYGPTRTVAWRVLDAQYFGLAQRRRRVFVVASARAGFDPLEVLFEREGVRRDTPPCRSQGQDAAGTITASTGGVDENDAADGRLTVFGGNNTAGPIDLAPARNACASASGRMDFESEAFIVSGTLQANGKAAGSATQQDAESGMLVVHGTQDPCTLTDQAFALGRNSGQENALLAFAENSRSEIRLEGGDGQVVGTLSTGGGKPGQGLPCIAFSCKDHGADAGELAPTLRAMGHGSSHPNAGGQIAICLPHAIQAGALRENPASGPDGVGVKLDHAYTLEARAEVQAVHYGAQVRRLTPRECERLQGFPDDYTLIPYRGRVRGLCPDGPRYKAIGNSKAVPVVRWIGQRLQQQLERSA